MIFLLRIDGCPLQDDKLSFPLKSWLSILADTINGSLEILEDNLNILSAPSYTAAQITALFDAGSLTNGIMLYDSTNNEYVGMISGSLVKFTTGSYP